MHGVPNNKMHIYNAIKDSALTQLAVLIDPDKHSKPSLITLANKIEKNNVSYIFIGGSLLNSNIEEAILILQSHTTKPIVLFPGNNLQLSNKANGILLLSLISGRNPEYLIGNHVISAIKLKNLNIEIMPTGYILIDGGTATSVEYMSNTRPIPANKPDIIVSTAVAGELLGLRIIYLEAGSGAQNPVSCEVINQVKQNINIPIIVGGGINTVEKLTTVLKSKPNVIVIGNVTEKYPDKIEAFSDVITHQ